MIRGRCTPPARPQPARGSAPRRSSQLGRPRHGRGPRRSERGRSARGRFEARLMWRGPMQCSGPGRARTIGREEHVRRSVVPAHVRPVLVVRLPPTGTARRRVGALRMAATRTAAAKQLAAANNIGVSRRHGGIASASWRQASNAVVSSPDGPNCAVHSFSAHDSGSICRRGPDADVKEDANAGIVRSSPPRIRMNIIASPNLPSPRTVPTIGGRQVRGKRHGEVAPVLNALTTFPPQADLTIERVFD